MLLGTVLGILITCYDMDQGGDIETAADAPSSSVRIAKKSRPSLLDAAGPKTLRRSGTFKPIPRYV